MRRHQLLPLLALTLALCAVPAGVSHAQWQVNGVPLCTVENDQANPHIASDGAGGAIVTWQDTRNGNYDIYAQRVNAAGVPQWPDTGVALCTAGATGAPTIVSDGAGGAIVTWDDYRNGNGDIYAQRVNAAGVRQWTDNGVALCAFPADQGYPTIASDGAGGAIVTWYDTRHGLSNSYVYAQRVDAAGAPQWIAHGIALCPAVSGQGVPHIVSDGAGGAIATWQDARRGLLLDIYAQRVSAAGAPQWTDNGVALCTAGASGAPTIVSDGAGGAIVTWSDTRNGNYDIYAQRVYGSGGVVAVTPPSAPAGFQLLAPFPNPTRDGQLTIRFNMPSSERVSAQVLDLAGHRVRALATEREFSPGPQMLGWDGRNDAGVRLPSGVYFVEVRAGTHSEARRAILLH